jgi:hypothetical protein
LRRFHQNHPDRPLIVALTGTDLYRDLPRSRRAQQALDVATRIIALQPKAQDELRVELRDKLRVIYQSFPARQRRAPPPSNANPSFDVCA